jgi:hypothetical protein
MDRSMALNSTAAASELMRSLADASMTFLRSMAGNRRAEVYHAHGRCGSRGCVDRVPTTPISINAINALCDTY